MSVTLTRDDPEVVLAAASLAYDAETFDALGAQARARAELVADGDRRSIQIVDASLPSPEAGADLEVWLIRPDDKGGVADLVSLGVVEPAAPSTLDVPADYDPALFFVVDISVEPRDGDAGHSGRSILRGPLQGI
ncbi:MAG: anti-sigma factor [Acidimicrobiia bacterium]|nr:anti-sigma factor [Acidimicrobiia bacterium]